MKYIIITTTLLLICGCANMVAPTGGQKDEKIPTLIKSNLSSLNFKDDNIKLEFDEYVILENQNSITIQPKHTTFTINNNAKTIRIKFDSSLRENTTYILNITSGIKDLNEGNLFSLSYIFSTGNIIDTNFVDYKLINYKEYKNLKIGLTSQSVDSIKKLKFEYIYSFTQENMTIQGLGNTLYKNWIFTDKNNDDIPDEYMPIYYDTIRINSHKDIMLNNWIDARNSKVIHYKYFTKIFKQINDENTYGLNQVIYIDRDSSLFYNFNSDTLPTLDFKKELNDKINDKIMGIKTNKDYAIVIDKCGIQNITITDKINFSQDENYFYINSRVKIDSINFRVMILRDSVEFHSKIKVYNELNQLSTIKITGNNKYNKAIMIVYQGDKIHIIKKINLKKDQLFYTSPGNYKIVLYLTDAYKNISFNLENLQRVNSQIMEKEILLKPNWDEVLQLNF